MNGLLRTFEAILTAVGFAEGGEFETANQIMEEYRTHEIRQSPPDANKIEGLKPLRVNE